jgi:hypothetical protein
MINAQPIFDELMDTATLLIVLSIIVAVVISPAAATYGAGIALGFWGSAGWMWLRGAV